MKGKGHASLCTKKRVWGKAGHQTKSRKNGVSRGGKVQKKKCVQSKAELDGPSPKRKEDRASLSIFKAWNHARWGGQNGMGTKNEGGFGRTKSDDTERKGGTVEKQQKVEGNKDGGRIGNDVRGGKKKGERKP